MNEKKLLQCAMSIMVDAHKDQTDKAGYPYILHPIRVMQNVNSMDAKVVALLHDVVEDSEFPDDVTKTIFWGFTDEIFDAVFLLTREEGTSYELYIDRIIASENKLAIIVKLADLMDNMNEDRLNELSNDVSARLRVKYAKAYDKIVNSIEGKCI